MKTPEQIKTELKDALHVHVHFHKGDPEPRLTHFNFHALECLHADALALIRQLESDNARLREKETPKPCEHKATLYKCLTCPSCGNVVSKHEMWGETEVRILPDYCKFCGQRIELPKGG